MQKKITVPMGYAVFSSSGGLVLVAIVTANEVSLTYLGCVGYDFCIH